MKKICFKNKHSQKPFVKSARNFLPEWIKFEQKKNIEGEDNDETFINVVYCINVLIYS